MRWSMLVISCVAPSAVCNIEMPSLALRTAWFRPRIWAVILLLMARPAASSAAELMRLPVDSCSMALLRLRLFTVRAFCATSDFTLVLITDMVLLLEEVYFKRLAGTRRE